MANLPVKYKGTIDFTDSIISKPMNNFDFMVLSIEGEPIVLTQLSRQPKMDESLDKEHVKESQPLSKHDVPEVRMYVGSDAMDEAIEDYEYGANNFPYVWFTMDSKGRLRINHANGENGESIWSNTDSFQDSIRTLPVESLLDNPERLNWVKDRLTK